MRRLFAMFAFQFEKEYETLWSSMYLRAIRLSFKSKSIHIDIFGFGHLQRNANLPSINSPNINPVDSYNSYTKLTRKAQEF